MVLEFVIHGRIVSIGQFFRGRQTQSGVVLEHRSSLKIGYLYLKGARKNWATATSNRAMLETLMNGGSSIAQ
jgi:hypothetical protein